MTAFHRMTNGIPSERPEHPEVDEDTGRLRRRPPAFTTATIDPAAPGSLLLAEGDAFGHALLACRARSGSEVAVGLATAEPKLADGRWVHEVYSRTDDRFTGPARLPLWVDEGGRIVSDDFVAIARALTPELFTAGREHEALIAEIRDELIDGALALGLMTDQAAYQRAYAALEGRTRAFESRLAGRRFLLGDAVDDLCFADLLLFTFVVRIDPVYFGLYKANAALLEDLPSLHAYARDLFELPELHGTTSFDAIVDYHVLAHPALEPRGIVPRGGRPDLDAPHRRARQFVQGAVGRAAGVEEDPTRVRAPGEWVRPRSEHRNHIGSDPRFPAQAGRYHLYAPYNCPWSHRALLARSVKGLAQVVGASIVYFRRDPEHGWQFNPAIPGCTADQVYGHRYLRALYEAVGSSEGSAPLLWDTIGEQIVSNESAEILRMFDRAFGDLAGHHELELVPEAIEADIDEVNEIVYQRINNGAYKAGFARSQAAYDRAYARYFSALDWVEARLADADFLMGTAAPTEADLRLFPTVFRHDAIYYTRFRLNLRRVAAMPALSAWLRRMMAWPGVAEASDLDHARNGYFGRTGNGIVPMGPAPLSLSPADYPRDVWLNRRG